MGGRSSSFGKKAAGTCEDPQQVAKEAIKTQDINFPRYCA